MLHVSRIAAFLVSSVCVLAQPQPIAELSPRIAKFPSPRELSLNEVLKELEDQTGNKVLDLRSNKTNPTLALKNDTFWKTLDAVGKKTGIGFSAYQEGGGVALVDAPYRDAKPHHSGMFRFALKRMTLTRDEETRTHTCQIALDIAWEPRLKLLYLGLDKAEIGYRKNGKAHRETIERQVNYSASATSALPLEFQIQAPERATRNLDSVKGSIRAIGAPKMLEFRLAKLEGDQTLEMEKVRVALLKVIKLANRWDVDVATIYPRVQLESFQEPDLLNLHRVWLSWTDAKGKTHTLAPTGWSPQAAKEGIRMRHEFQPRAGAPLPPANAVVALHVVTPNRIVEFTVPFELQDLPLP